MTDHRATKTFLLVYLLSSLAMSGLVAAQPDARRADVDDSYLRYIHPTIREPFVDLVNLSVPAELKDQPLAALGYVDVTKGPFRADPTGTQDSTAAVQAAVLFARDHQMVCFFPPGTYRLSDTLECVQQLYRRANGRVFGGNRFPNLLVGSRVGTQRPKLLLAPRAPGFGDPARPKIFIHFWSRGYLNPTTADRVSDGLPPEVEQPNIGMNQMLVNLDVVIGEGNAGAVAVRHQAAEGSAIEDCTIDATHGLTGIQGGIGSGGSSTAVTVIGGRVGLDFTGYLSGTQPTPVVTGFTLIGQTEAAIRSTSRQTLVAAGLKIVADRCARPLIQVGAGPAAASSDSRPASGLRTNHGNLTLADSQIEFTGAALTQPDRVAVLSERGVYLHNVYLHGATKALFDPKQDTTLPGNPEGWLRIRRYAHTGHPLRDQGVEYRYPVYVDSRCVQRVCEVESDQQPPADLQSRHLWAPGFPSFESPGAVNVKAAPYEAQGDGRADDTAALQRAVDENEIVFLPKGCYRLTRTLDLKPHTKLIGAGQHLSFLVATREAALGEATSELGPLVRTADAADADTHRCGRSPDRATVPTEGLQVSWRPSVGRSGGVGDPRRARDPRRALGEATSDLAPLVRTADAADADTVLSFLGLYTPGEVPGISALHWRCGGGSVFRAVEIRVPTARATPVLITGHGGGNWYNFRASRGPQGVPDYRHLVVDGASGPLRFYQFSPQHAISDFAAEIRNSRDVSIFGTKYEGNQPMLAVRDSDHIRLFGHGGNAKGLPGNTLFLFERTPNFLFANGVDGPTKIGTRSLSHPIGSTDPRQWHMLIEGRDDGSQFKLPPLERPVYYGRGRPHDAADDP